MNQLQNIKTCRSARISSLPKVQRNPYLELFMLQSEKEKLSIEYKATNKKLMITDSRLKEIESQIKELQNKRGYYKPKKTPIPKGHSDVIENPSVEAKEWGTMKIKY